MDKPKCRLCGERHWGNCEGVEPSRGDPRTEPDTSILTRNVPDKPPPRRPSLVPDRPVTKPVTSNATVTECPRCVTLSRDILTLERDATLYRNKIAALETELRCELNKTRTKPPPLTPAERQRRRRERQAAKVRSKPNPPPAG